jgi:aspartate/glutamate racemase
MNSYAGILATGANAGTWYFSQLLEQAMEKWGADYVLPVKTLTVPFEPINALLPDRMEEAAEKMLPYFHEMEKLGIKKYILANITLHEAFDKVKGKIYNHSLLHLREIIEQVFAKKQKIMIIGTLYTMNNPYLPSLFNAGTVEFLTASESLQQQIDALRKVFYHRRDDEMAAMIFDRLLREHPEVDTFVIACTEHALALEKLADKSRFISLPHLQIEYLLKDLPWHE